MSAPAASVVVPSYNHRAYLGAALDSALGQDADLEVLVIDDGSTDGTPAALAARPPDARLRLLCQENRGAHAALNRGLEECRGEVVFLLNSDDEYAPGRIPALLERFAAEPELAVLASWLEVIDPAGKTLGTKRGFLDLPPWPQPRPGPSLEALGDLQLALLQTNFVATTSNLAFRRGLLERGLRFRALRYCHDWDFVLAASLAGRFELVPEPLVRYRVHQSNTIAEGTETGQGAMRFEIQWVLACHCEAVLAAALSRGRRESDLRERAARSLPGFGAEGVLRQLLVLRGNRSLAPPSYLALLDPDHPFRRAAIRALQARAENR